MMKGILRVGSVNRSKARVSTRGRPKIFESKKEPEKRVTKIQERTFELRRRCSRDLAQAVRGGRNAEGGGIGVRNVENVEGVIIGGRPDLPAVEIRALDGKDIANGIAVEVGNGAYELQRLRA